MKKWHLTPGHLRSQKYSALVFCVTVCAGLAFVLSVEKLSTLVMGVVALYTAFVGGRAWSDGQSLKYGGNTNTTDVSVAKPLPKKDKEID